MTNKPESFEELVATVRAKRPELGHLDDIELLSEEQDRLLRLTQLAESELTKDEQKYIADILRLTEEYLL